MITKQTSPRDREKVLIGVRSPFHCPQLTETRLPAELKVPNVEVHGLRLPRRPPQLSPRALLYTGINSVIAKEGGLSS